MKHFFALLMFFPITTIYILVRIAELLWKLLHALHYEHLENMAVYHDDLLPSYLLDQLTGDARAISVFLLCIILPFVEFWEALKLIGQYKF